MRHPASPRNFKSLENSSGTPTPLLLSRRFLPLWIIQITSAFGDNLFKSAFVMLITFRLAPDGISVGAMSALAGASLVAPYFLFSSLAGEIADKYDRAGVIRVLKCTELAIALLAGATLIYGSAWPALLTLFGLGSQATFISPVKYAILPQHLAQEELVAGNALFEGATFLTVLIGTIAGGVTAVSQSGVLIASGMLILVSAGGVIAALFVQPAPAPAPKLKLNYNPLSGNLAVVREAARQPPVNRAILSISWFWLVGAVLISQFPVWAKTVLGADSSVVTFFLGAFSVGIGLGAGLATALAHGKPTTRLAAPALLIMAACCFCLWFASHSYVPLPGHIVNLWIFLSGWTGWEISSALLSLAIAGGVFVVPLYALIQQMSDETTRARIIAANNIWNAIYMTSATLALAVLLQFGLPIPAIFALLGLGSLAMATFAGFRMSKRETRRDGKAPGQRQLRVGEEIRHVLAAIMERGELRDPGLQNRTITVTEVRTSPDLRNAIAYIVPLGGLHSAEILAALQKVAPYLRGVVGRELSLRFTPQLSFELDRTFDHAAHIEALMQNPVVARDLEDEADTESEEHQKD